jgi:hypothetical protein
MQTTTAAAAAATGFMHIVDAAHSSAVNNQASG